MASSNRPKGSGGSRRPRERRSKRSAQSIAEPIFAGETSNVVPGELIVQLREDAAGHVTSSIPRGPTRGAATPGPESFGIEPLDRALRELKVTSIVSLHPPAPRVTAAAAEAAPMAATYRVRFAAATEVEAAAGRLEALGEVEYAEPNRYRETFVVPNDPSFASQWGLTKINCPAAWDRTTGSANVVVAVIDTGIDLDHPELAPLLVGGTDMVDLGTNPIPPAGFHFEGDFVGRDADPADEVGHGTHVAGTIACLSNNGTGVAGVTWSCRLMPVRVLARIVSNTNPADVRGVGSAADIAAGIRWAVDHGARVLNLSLGGTVDTQVERDAIAYAVAQGAVVVAAMGNAHHLGNPVNFPAAYPDVVAVGATTQADQRAFFSQTGPHIDVVAPGVGILSTVWDNGYATYQGTSMASPHVAGVAALILSCNQNLTAAQVADIIRQTARPLKTAPTDPVPNDDFGFGLVDAEAALARACPPRPSVPILTCPSVVSICRPSRPILSCPSVVTICGGPERSVPIWACPISISILSCPSHALTCPSARVITCPMPSLQIRCPSGPVCAIERPGDPFPGRTPHGDDPHGTGGNEWQAYDPYAMRYGDEDEG